VTVKVQQLLHHYQAFVDSIPIAFNGLIAPSLSHYRSC
jgi:hypothetical protein